MLHKIKKFIDRGMNFLELIELIIALSILSIVYKSLAYIPIQYKLKILFLIVLIIVIHIGGNYLIQKGIREGTVIDKRKNL